MISDNTNDFILKYPPLWEHFLKKSNINKIFSQQGISDYTRSKNINTSELAIIPEDDFTDSGWKSVKSNSKDHNKKHYKISKTSLVPTKGKKRVILSTPFTAPSVASYGLIVLAQDTRRIVVIQRKHSIEFLLIFRGFYRPTFLRFLLSQLVENECSTIKTCLLESTETFINIYLKGLNLPLDGLLYALVRMAESREEILRIIADLDLSQNSLLWTWPKGRLNISLIRETQFDCAKREFLEEAEISLPPPLNQPSNFISEFTTTVTGRNIEAHYWLYVIPKEIPLTAPKGHPEVSDRLWIDINECSRLIPILSSHKKRLEEYF